MVASVKNRPRLASPNVAVPPGLANEDPGASGTEDCSQLPPWPWLSTISMGTDALLTPVGAGGAVMVSRLLSITLKFRAGTPATVTDVAPKKPDPSIRTGVPPA